MKSHTNRFHNAKTLGTRCIMQRCKLDQTWSENGLYATFVPNLHPEIPEIPQNTTSLSQSIQR